MSEEPWLLYGATGYTGRLTAEEACRRGMRPTLAGRREGAVREIAERLDLPVRAFPLDDPHAVARGLEGMRAVLLCAGPFSATSRPVVDACLARGVHYLDITGEIGVFEACHRRNDEARAAGVVLMPGTGFDVVPSDCLAASLNEAMPDADHLELAFSGGGGASRGTTKTAVEGLGQGGAIRDHGRIRRVPMAWRTREVPFRDRPRLAVSIPWGDVSTAFYSTGIGNIVVFMAISPRGLRIVRVARHFTRFLALGVVQRLLKALVDRRVKDPDPGKPGRDSQLWGRVTNAKGDVLEGTLNATPPGYPFTAMTSVECVRRVLAGEVEPGARTPSMAFGADFMTSFEGCDLQIGA